jgi:hypothetical protein
MSVLGGLFLLLALYVFLPLLAHGAPPSGALAAPSAVAPPDSTRTFPKPRRGQIAMRDRQRGRSVNVNERRRHDPRSL